MTYDDISAAKLISRSLVEPLTDQEQIELQQYLSNSEDSQKFADLSAQIQQILAGPQIGAQRIYVSESNSTAFPIDTVDDDYADQEPGPGLSQLSRARLAKRLVLEMQSDAASQGDSSEPDRSAERLVAEDKTIYRCEPRPKADDESN